MKPGMKLLAMETMRRSSDTSRPRMDGDYVRMGMARKQGRERYNDGRYAPQGSRRDYETRNEMEEPMDTIGFNTDMIYNAMDEPRREGRDMRGTGMGAGMEFSRETAMEWTKAMENSDGSKGAHWTPEQTKQQMNQVGFRGSPDEFYAIMNSVYSDYSAVIKRYGVDRADFYAHLAKAWLEDKDAVEDKVAAYYEYVVKH